MNTLENNNEKRSEFSEIDDELIHVRKIPPRIEHERETRVKTLGFEMNYPPETPWKEIRGDITHQYLKFVNAHLVERINLIEKLTSIQDNIRQEIDILKSNDLTRLIKMTNLPIGDLTSNEISEIEKFMNLQPYLKERNNSDASNDSKPNEMTLEESTNSSTELDNLVKDELEFLIKKYGMKELTYAVDIITSSKMIRNNRDLE
ncbi:MAG: hypothetical protein R3230_03875 [Nitrosopumilaceae archaeon]|nr:hypothetical protein [Nitrosopumilaceae archaeon]